MRFSLLTAVLVVAVASPSAAQKPKWTQIGTTSSGNPVYVDQKTVKKTGDHVDATIRVVFVKPVETPKGVWMSSRISGTFDSCPDPKSHPDTCAHPDLDTIGRPEPSHL